MRLFVALPVDEAVRERLAAAVGRWRDEHGRAGWRWTRPQGWHVTVAFLGEVDEEVVGGVVGAVGDGAVGTGSIDLRLGGLDRFGRRVLHAGLEDDPPGAVARLGASVQGSLVAADLPVQEREVHPHLTLARAGKRKIDAPPEGLEVPVASWRVEDVRLYLSRPGDRGPRYEVIERFPLA